MIKQLEVKNFRNIPFAMYSFTSPKTVLFGANGIGKSNTLNALMWMITGTLLTDKYGVGENDIVSIIPNNYQKGQHTEVSIWTESGTKFTKRYKCTFQKGTDRINGHTTELLINDVLQSKISDFEEELWKALDYAPAFKTKDIKELNLFSDPLYALQKLDAEKLRKLLVAIGCSVANEEVEGYNELISISNKYLGDFDKAALDLKKQANAIEKEITSVESKLETVSDVEEFDSTELDNLNKLKESRIKDKVNIKGSKIDEALNQVNNELTNLIAKRDLEWKAVINELELKKQEIDNAITLESDKLSLAFKEKTGDLRLDIQCIKHEIESNQVQIKNYEDYYNKYNNDIESYKNEAKNGRELIRDYSIKLAAVQVRSYDNYITCPHCNESFPLSEEGKKQFEIDKENDVNHYRSLIERCQSKDGELKNKVLAALSERDAVKVEQDKLINVNEALIKELNEKEEQLHKLSIEPVDTSVIDALEQDCINIIHEIDNAKLHFPKYEEEIRVLTKKRHDIINNNDEAVKLELMAIDEALLDIEDKLSAEYVKRSKWAEKVDYQKRLEVLITELNNTEALRAKVIQFVQRRINLLNERAYKKTGIKFVMAEANLGDGSIKEQTVCYATVNGVPFKDVNTAKKVEVGVNFIAKLKEIAMNDFGAKFNKIPVLMDKLECFDSVDKISKLPAYQLVGTAVNSSESIDIISI